MITKKKIIKSLKTKNLITKKQNIIKHIFIKNDEGFGSKVFDLIFAIYLYKLYIYQLLYAIVFINVRGILMHDNQFIYLVGDHHLIHHKYYKCNYGEYWLDYLFGTLHDNS